jgi:hypothetical protein
MNATIAQLVVLTCYGNAALSGRVAVPGVFPENSACRYCERVVFVDLTTTLFGNPRQKRVAATPDDWFDFLRRSKAGAIRLRWTPRNDPRIEDHQSAAFIGGGGDWVLAVSNAQGTAYWRSRWTVFDRNAPQRIWHVIYGPPVHSDGVTAQAPVDAVDSIALRKALTEILAFSQAHGTDGFSACFRAALDSLDGVATEPAPQVDLHPPGLLAREAGAVLDAAQKAWVFGGMGSWNDMSFEGDTAAEYARVSRQLYAALAHAICAAANQSVSAAAAAGAQPQ